MRSMSDAPGTPITIATLPNLRDVGGWPTHEGRTVRRGQLYRSVELSKLDDAGLAAFTTLGVRTVFDLRTEPERSAEPDRVPPGTAHVVADVLADMKIALPARLTDLFEDPVRTSESLGDGRALELIEQAYRDIIGLPSALHAYRLLYTSLADADRRPALIHCTTGKDRTGWGAAALLMLLGVSPADVQRDYLRTNDDLLPALQPVFDRFAAGGGDPDLLRPLLGVDAAYLDAALAEMRTRFASIEGYFADGLGIDAAGRDALRAAFLD
jgi:protein-tyrosine phosphatase